MEINSKRITILKLLEEKGPLSSKKIEQETRLPREHVLAEIEYLKKMEQIECVRVLSGDILNIRLTKDGQETLESNRSLWKKISSKIKGFNIAGFGIEIK